MIFNYLKSLAISILSLLLLTLIMTLLSYFNIIGNTFINILELIIPIFSLFIGSFLLGKSAKEKGYLEGIKFSLIFIIILVLFNYLGLKINFEFNDLIFYLILIISSTLGSMIGINFSKGKN